MCSASVIGMWCCDDADDDAADEVDRDDEHAGHRVALDELRGAVHRAVEVGLAADLGAARRAPPSSVIRPAFRSASIAICLPGIASRVKRAATSATRPAPFVMTTNWMTTRMKKTTSPTTRLPPTTNEPKAWMTPPASPCSRMRRVTLTLIARRQQRREAAAATGTTEKSSAFGTYIVVITIASAPEMFTAMSEVEQRRRQRHDHHHDDHDDGERRGEVAVLQESLESRVHALTPGLCRVVDARRRASQAGDGPCTHASGLIDRSRVELRWRTSGRREAARSFPYATRRRLPAVLKTNARISATAWKSSSGTSWPSSTSR